MINLADYVAFVSERKNNFDNQCNALRFSNNLTTLAALYIDLLTSNHGEKWNNNLLFRELDDIFEELKEQGVMFRGQLISDRRTGKDDPFIIKFVEVVPKVVTLKNEDGTDRRDEKGHVMKQENGTKEVTKKKHIHAETMDIMNTPKTNAFGIPVMRLYGEYHAGGFFPTTNTYQALQLNPSRNALRVATISSVKRVMQDYENAPAVHSALFTDIEARCQYGLSSISEILVANNSSLKRAGLVRLDYDLEDGQPVIAKATLLFETQTFINSHVSVRNLLSNTMTFIKERAEEAGLTFSTQFKRTVIAPKGYETFEKLLLQVEATSVYQVNTARAEQERLRDAIIRNEELAEKEAERRAAEREAEKARLKKEREQERQQKATEKAEKAVKKHDKDVENMMTSLVASIINAGGTPGRTIYQSMREDIKNDVASGETSVEEVELIFEALDKLISTDTNA